MWSSYSHYLVSDLAGVSQRRWAGGWGYRALTFLPASSGLGLSHARAELELSVGRVVHEWRRHGGVQCGKAAEDRAMRLECGERGGVIIAVDFASFGAPRGVCGAFEAEPSCHAAVTTDVVARACLGQNSCEIRAEAEAFAVTPGVSAGWCSTLHHPGASARLWAQVRCSAPPMLSVRVEVPLASTAKVVLPVSAVAGEGGAHGSVRVVEDKSRAVLYPDGVHGRGSSAVDVTPVTASADSDHAGRAVVSVGMGSGAYELSMASI